MVLDCGDDGFWCGGGVGDVEGCGWCFDVAVDGDDAELGDLGGDSWVEV